MILKTIYLSLFLPMIIGILFALLELVNTFHR